MANRTIFIGTAGWSIAKRYSEVPAAPGTHLERYARRLNCAEINTSFYRPHKRQTYERWAGSVPEQFRFSAKLPKTITHDLRLSGCDELLAAFLDEVEGLGTTLGALLVQLPPGLVFDASVAETFFAMLRAATDVAVACEPRHASWFSPNADELLERFRVARVAADPARFESAGQPGGCRDFAYFRMHGTPRIYYSDYDAAMLTKLESELRDARVEGSAIWCIFDNTAASHALDNAVSLAQAFSE